jgi:formamidopyrimidine-DNA glycosylase
MPELVEVEAYRRLADKVVGRRVAEVVAPDAWYLKRGLDPATAESVLTGATVTGTRRIGKLLMLDLDADRPVLGLRFGMSGRLVVDGQAGVDELIYAPVLRLDKWDRFGLRFHADGEGADGEGDGGDLRMQDPRRLGGVELDPPEARMGPDALTITPSKLAAAIGHGRSTAPLKARLMDQSRIAGVGNLAADELLWRAGLDPARLAGGLRDAELRRLHRHLRGTMSDLMARGGSHAGDLMAERRVGGVCPKDGTPLVRRTVGGRTTFSCPKHQT